MLAFITFLFDLLETNPAVKMTDALELSYKAVFARHHPWMVQQAVKVATMFSCSKEKFFANAKI